MTDLTLPAMIDPSLRAAGPSAGQTPRNAAGIAKVAEDFEAFFAGLVFDEMTADIEPDPVTGGGEGESMFKSLLNQEYGKAVASTHALGIADVVQRQLLQIQEVA
ncbi:rod-binding protein [Dongia sp.]|uniref:rod-binding protein n=1 Tax=Dongia sp. TaxID=1977262 RepID=UPI0035AE2C64